MSHQPPIYAIPGLGMTPDIFDHLQLKHGQIRPVAWIEPHDEAETFPHYCLRMAEQIEAEKGPVRLIGMSFGGILASELARMLPVQELVLISTIKTHRELPPWLRLMQQLPLYKFHYRWGRRSTTRFWAPLFGIDTPEYQSFCSPMFNSYSDSYFRWAIQQIVHWKNEQYPARTLHLHGDQDRIFPVEHLGPCEAVLGGDHFMVYKRGAELSALIDDWLDQRSPAQNAVAVKGA